MKKVLLINSMNRKSEPPRHYPYGLAIITTIIKQAGHSVDTFDGNFKTFEELANLLKTTKYDFIGISGLITTFNYQKSAAEIARKHNPKAIIGCGGGLASAVDKELLEIIPEVDVLFVGEGENIIPLFLEEMGKTDYTLKGIAYKKNGTIIRNADAPLIDNLDDFPLPDLHAWHIEKYFENKSFPLSPNTEKAVRRGNIITSRGCPYRCDFCFNILGRNKVRYRSAESVLKELEDLVKRYNIDYISFMDEEFLVNKRLVREIIAGMKERRWNLKWSIATRATSVNPEILSEIKKAGCDFIYYGFDSGSESTLLYMNKKATLDDNFNAFKITVEAEIYPVPNLIIGYENETLKNIQENMAFLQRLIEWGKTLKSKKLRDIFVRGFNNFGAIYYATPYPGSELFHRNRNNLPPLREILEKVSNKDAYELTINMSKIPDEELIKENKKMESFVRGFKL